jgi:hypothetical protein
VLGSDGVYTQPHEERAMLSFIYHIANEFEQEHGFSPNLICMNYTHLECLKQEILDPDDLESIVQLLGMEIVVHQQASLPTVTWSEAPWRQTLAS